ncbi:TPA: hypothetical protein ACGQ50_001275 [Enterobacter cloacae]|uniref:Cap15 family cyclic dinucleotide receptor domain-containing protein n=1 Tax=Enterobacter cloacae TaxID=550 RepID=UPI00207522B5|nr:hypothetical protein [Enterobacter cloacae]
MKSHEYIVICGINRSKVGKILGGIASLLSAGLIYTVLLLLARFDIFSSESTIPPSVSSLLSAGAIYVVLYAWFDSSLWKRQKIARFLKIPDLSGEWDCIGEGRDKEGKTYNWNALIKIAQTWDKVHIRMQTAQSGSDSVAASIIYDEGIGYRLIYNYRNDPKINEPELHSHMGFAEFTFNEDISSAEGEYFNGRGRNTFGTMSIKRKKNDQ